MDRKKESAFWATHAVDDCPMVHCDMRDAFFFLVLIELIIKDVENSHIFPKNAPNTGNFTNTFLLYNCIVTKYKPVL